MVVRDEPGTRDVLGELLAAHDGVTVIGQVSTGTAALRAVRCRCPDLLIVGLQLPDMMGFDLLRRLAEPPLACSPLAILVAPAGDYALHAFDCGAVDYIVEPFTADRLMRAVDRAVARQHERWAAESLLDVLATCERALPVDAIQRCRQGRATFTNTSPVRSADAGLRTVDQSRSFRDRFLISVGARDAVVETAEIMWIRANGCYATLVTAAAAIPRFAAGAKPQAGVVAAGRPGDRVEYLIRVSLDQLEQELDPARFLRVHRSAIANIERIRGTERSPRRGIVVVLDDGTRIPVSRSRRPALLRALGGHA